MDEQTSVTANLENDFNYTPTKNATNNNEVTSSNDDVFVDSKKQLNLNGVPNEGYTSPVGSMDSPSRQQVIGDVIKEVISDHLNGDNPVPRMVPLDDGTDKDSKDQLHNVNSEKEMTSTDKTDAINVEIESNGHTEINGIEEINTRNNEDKSIGNEPELRSVPLKDKIDQEVEDVGALNDSSKDNENDESEDANKVDSMIDNLNSDSVEPELADKNNGDSVESEAEKPLEESKSDLVIENESESKIASEIANDQIKDNESVSIIERDRDNNLSASHHPEIVPLEIGVEEKEIDVKKESVENTEPSTDISVEGEGGKTIDTHVKETDIFVSETVEISSEPSITVGVDSDAELKTKGPIEDVEDKDGIGKVEEIPHEGSDAITLNVEAKDKPGTETSIVEQDTENKEETEKKESQWLDILGNGLLKKMVIKEGLGRESRPTQGDVVHVRCEGKLEDGTIVDKNSCLQLVLGDADVIQAIDMCVALMEDKETCTLFTDARYAYSIYGRPDYKPPIPQNASLTYELEILSIIRGKSIMEMTCQECLLYSDKKRTRGNDLYSRGDNAGAIDSYKRCLRYLEGRKEKEVLDMKIKCLNNLSAAQLKVKAYVMALQSLEVVLDMTPNNVKAIYRKGKCLEGLGKDKDALECMKNASALDPENKLIIQDLGRLRSRVAVTQQKEKEIYRRMFQQNQEKNEEVVEEEESEEENDNSILPLVGSAMVAAVAVIGGLMWYKYRLS